jgi:hypothetical protein
MTTGRFGRRIGGWRKGNGWRMICANSRLDEMGSM